ncbi:hypothetical protein PSCLAVI8L_80141 [Pseudoclavibacter sp. 8L]|nr:hypothetical protein PSCLAVI8L_80141 [Pseudoclavibacter sp. 8L]
MTVRAGAFRLYLCQIALASLQLLPTFVEPSVVLSSGACRRATAFSSR